MSLQFDDPDQWYAEYDEASTERQYEILLETIKNPLTPEFIEEIDLFGSLIDILEQLIENNLINDAVSFIEQFQKYQPELYSEEFDYFDRFLVKYYLHTSQYEEVKAALVRFEEEPNEVIDEMLEVLDFLKFYNATEIARDLCQKTYELIKDDDVDDGIENEIGEVFFLDLLDQTYQKVKQGESVDWQELLVESEKYGIDTSSKVLTFLQQELVNDFQVDKQFFQNFKKLLSHKEIYRSLSLAFYKYMADNKQVSFICSQGIWDNILIFLGEYRDIKPKKLTHPDNLFGFSQTELEDFVKKTIDDFTSLDQAAGFATLWGIPYLYDFLLSKQIISSEIHLKVLTAVSELKKELMEKLSSSLWQYDFVHCWLPPDNVSQEDWEAEIDQFRNSTTLVAPLSSEPNESRSKKAREGLQALINAIEENKEILRELFNSKDQDKELFNSKDEDIDISPPSTKSFKPKKSKKSPLQEAAELIAQEDKKSDKKKKKGFN